MAKTFSTILREIAARTPEAPALTCGEETWTFAELDARSSRTAQALLAEGVTAGDRVGVLSRNRPEFYELIFACNKIGAIFVGLNWRLAPPEIDAILADAMPTMIFVGEAGEGALLSEQTRQAPGLRRIVSFGEDFKSWRASAPARDPGHVGTPDEVAMILYTSGTTGLPKGAMLTNRGMSYTQRLGAEAWDMGPDSVNLVAMPLFHIGGSGYGSSTMLVGGHTVLMREVDLPLIVKTMEARRVTHAFFVPTVVQGLLDVPGVDKADLSSLKLLMYGASPIGETLLRRALAVLKCDFMQAYGMTETSGTVVTLDPQEHRLDREGVDRLRSCGRPLPFAEIRIAEPAAGEECPVGSVGEIWIRSPMVMKGYWKNLKATADAITPDGWLRTGDAAYRDADGFIYLYDRIKDMIISGGENIYPAEIENALLSHPGVSEAGVIGVPHERWGETPRAIVVCRPGHAPGEEELIAFARTRLARYKCPTSVLFTESLPRNASGKLLKRELARQYGSDERSSSAHPSTQRA
jgi:acyl-CoA synthetase (AMP-forming)/AMP-acid ligase II